MGWQRCFFSKKYFDGLSVLLLYYLAVLVVHQQIHVMAVGATSPSSAKFYRIHWNSSNPIFRIDNTDNIIDVNRNNAKFEYDQVNLICPVYTPGTTQDDEMEKYIIYNVSKDEYDTCRITNPNPRIIAVCDKPYKLMYFTITFRPFTPQPGGLEFLPGHDYYFISTSTSDDLHRRIGGRCTTHNMKIVFKVWGPAAPPPPPTVQPPQAPSINSGATRWWKQVTSSPPSRTASSANDPPLPPYHFSTPSYPPPPYYVTAANGGATLPPNSQGAHPTATTKKSKTYNKHPNEVVKSEELTLGGGTSSSSGAPALLVASTRPNNNNNNVIINKLSLLIVCAATIVVICGGGAWQR